MNEKRAVHALIHNTQCSHTRTQTVSHIHSHMQMVLLPLLFFFSSPCFLSCVYWYYYGAMLCNICKFLLLLPTTVFPKFPPPHPPCHNSEGQQPLSRSVDICWHHSAHCCRWCFLFCLLFAGASSLLLLYNL